MGDMHEAIFLGKFNIGGGGGTSNVQDLVLTMNPTTYVITAYLVDGNGTRVGTERTIDIPLESTIVGASYDNTSKDLTFTLTSGATLTVPLDDIIYGLQPLIDSTHKLPASLVDDTQGRFRFTWVGTQAQFAIDGASLPAGTPYIITDDDVAPCYFDSTTGEFYVNGTKVLAVMTEAAYEALTTKSNIWYATYPTPSQNSGRSLETSPLTKNENSEGEDVKEAEPETKKSVEMEISDKQLDELPPFGFGGYDE